MARRPQYWRLDLVDLIWVLETQIRRMSGMQSDMRATVINLCDLHRSRCHGTNTGQQFRHTQAIETTFEWYHPVQRSSLLSLILRTEPFYTISSFFSHQGLIHTRPAFSCPEPIPPPFPLFSFTAQLISIFFLMHMSKFILTPFLVSLASFSLQILLKIDLGGKIFYLFRRKNNRNHS